MYPSVQSLHLCMYVDEPASVVCTVIIFAACLPNLFRMAHCKQVQAQAVVAIVVESMSMCAHVNCARNIKWLILMLT